MKGINSILTKILKSVYPPL